jgi:23S rRNA (uracil1939-C5)-methyltransferase
MQERKKRKFDVLENITIEKAGGEGKALAYHDQKVVFVKGGAPGDIGHVRLTKVKGRYMEGDLVTLIQPSPIRQTPVCEHFGICGGCKWQHIRYEEQLHIKNQWAVDCLERIGKLHIKNILPPMGAPSPWAYRNKVEFTFSDKSWEETFDKNQPQRINGLGYHIPGRWDKVLDIHYCHLTEGWVNNTRVALKNLAISQGLSFWDARSQTGYLRNLMFRQSSLGDKMLMLSVSEDKPKQVMGLLEPLMELFPEINHWIYVINSKKNDSWTGLTPIILKGEGYLREEMDGLIFHIQPMSFFQTNTEQALRLYRLVKEWADIQPHEVVYDLYTGTGTIAQFVAGQAKKVVGLEYVESAVEDARFNAAVNKLHNTHFMSGDIKEVFTEELFEKHGTADVLIVDPPRDGMHPDVVNVILASGAKRMVYVSCNPSTQARDLQMLSPMYSIEQSQAVDLFPHTHHIENVVLLQLR